ncbi:MAG: glycosyltransferase family 4 protein [Verrucomicrobiota bacterium]
MSLSRSEVTQFFSHFTLPLNSLVKQSRKQMKVAEEKAARNPPLTVAWISNFPLEWLPELPESLRGLPKSNPGTWQLVLLEEFQKNPALNIHVIVLRKNIERDLVFERNKVVFHVLKIPGGLRAPSFFWIDTFRIRRELEKIKPHVVHAWGTEQGAALVASRLPYPYLVTIQGLLTWYKKLIPLVRYDRFAAWLEDVSLRRANIATTESNFAVHYLQERYSKLCVHQAEHAANWFFHQIQRRSQIDPVRFIYVGTLCYRKGTDLLLRALNEIAREIPFELMMVSGANREFVNQMKPSLSAEFWRRIIFKTDLSPSEVAEELAQATIMLMPTRADTSPNAVKEAVVAGVPVVASKIGGIVDYVFEDKNGMLFDSGDLPGFIAAIRKACCHPQFSRGRVDAETLEQMRNYLSPSAMHERFFEAYEKTRKSNLGCMRN